MEDPKLFQFEEYDFAQPWSGLHEDPADDLLQTVMNTKAFQRLNSIRFLGGIDYAMKKSPNGRSGNLRYTRFQHSLGVARLALYYCNFKNLSLEDRRLVSMAALLHDIGHAPLSHSLEPVFKEYFNIDHHKATKEIILGRSPLGSELHEVLKIAHVDLERLVAIIEGNEDGFDDFFNGPINFDTIEGIMRTQVFLRRRPTFKSPETVVRAAISRSNSRDKKIVDEFWTIKNETYHDVINSKIGLLADIACQFYMRANIKSMKYSDYFCDEEQIFYKLKGLRNLLKSTDLESVMAKNIGTALKFKTRNFYINSDSNFFDRKDAARYLQSKEIDNLTLQNKVPATQEMFNL
jgi:uncharacterized protein